MSDLSYNIVWSIGYPICWVSSKRVILHRDRTRRPGAYILASNHLSPFDVPTLIAYTPRYLDFLSTIEMLRNPFVAWLYRRMNCEFVDRSRPDASTARALARKLERGRVVAMFPEGNIRKEEECVIHGGRFKPGAVRLAQIANVPIIPCVVLGSAGYWKFTSWLPLRHTPIGVIYGTPIEVSHELDEDEARQRATEQLRQAYLDLYAELKPAMEARFGAQPGREPIPQIRTEPSRPETPEPR